MENLISTSRAGDLLGISRQSVYRLVGRGTLPARWICGRLLISRVDVYRLADDAGYRRRSRARG